MDSNSSPELMGLSKSPRNGTAQDNELPRDTICRDSWCQERSAPGRTLCHRHLKQDRNRVRTKYNRRKAAGSCPKCGGKTATGEKRICEKCLADVRSQRKRREAKMTAKNQCTRCSGPLPLYTRYRSCAGCRERLRMCKARKKLGDNVLCISKWCKKKLPPTWVYERCEECRLGMAKAKEDEDEFVQLLDETNVQVKESRTEEKIPNSHANASFQVVEPSKGDEEIATNEQTPQEDDEMDLDTIDTPASVPIDRHDERVTSMMSLAFMCN